jgi:hypothetical protein
MAIRIPNVDASHQSRRSMGPQGAREALDSSAVGPTTPHRRVGMYERLGGLPSFVPSKTLGAAVVFLAMIIALIIAFVR